MLYSIKGLKRSNSKEFKKVIFESASESETIKYMVDNDIKVINRPYMFTHLILNNNMILTCSVNGMLVSPGKIANKLN